MEKETAIYTFRHEDAEFCYDSDNLRLMKGATRISLEHKPREVLAHLLKNPQKLIRYPELKTAVWGKTHVEDASVHNAVSKVNVALKRAQPGAEDFIRTVPGVGVEILVDVDPALAGENKVDRVTEAKPKEIDSGDSPEVPAEPPQTPATLGLAHRSIDSLTTFAAIIANMMPPTATSPEAVEMFKQGQSLSHIKDWCCVRAREEFTKGRREFVRFGHLLAPDAREALNGLCAKIDHEERKYLNWSTDPNVLVIGESIKVANLRILFFDLMSTAIQERLCELHGTSLTFRESIDYRVKLRSWDQDE